MKPRLGIFNKINDIPLNVKFLLIYIVCILIPIISINALFLDRLLTIVYEREENNYKISLERCKSDINKIIDGCVSVSHSVTTDTTLNDLLDKEYTDREDYYEIFDSLLRNRLNLYPAAYDYISSINIYVDNPSITPGGTYYLLEDSIKALSWYKTIKSTSNPVILFSYIGITSSIPKRPTQYISILRGSQGYPEQGIREKVLKVDINPDRICSILKGEKDYLNLIVVDSGGNIVCTPDNGLGMHPENGFSKYQPDILDKDTLIFEESLGSAFYLSGWKLIGTANRALLARAAKQTITFVIFLAIAFTLVSTFLIYIIVRSYNYRLKRLSRHMLKLKDGQFDLIVVNEGKDEIGGVIRNFNMMAAKINALINDVYKLELQKKDLDLERVRAELNFLQSQMNPHFLFNTLNAMVVDCTKNNFDSVSEVLKYLSKPLRRLMSWKDDIVPVEEEIAFTEMYMKIEKYRFREKFNYTIQTDEEAKNFRIPKMSLQPLVENACKHGIQAIKGIGAVSLAVTVADGKLCACVEDNGTGMDNIKLDEVLQNIKEEDDSGYSIGIRNVYRRLMLYYGDTITFNIESRVNYGTSVSFTIPVEKLV